MDKRFLLDQLFFLGKTEAEVGKALRLTQPAVAKPKQQAVEALAALLRPRSLTTVRSGFWNKFDGTASVCFGDLEDDVSSGDNG